MYALPEITGELRKPVEFIEIRGGIYFRSIVLEAGEVVPQHVHEAEHATYVGMGAVRLWVDGVWREDVEEGHAIEIAAGRQHLFQALRPTRLACVWREDVAMSMLKGD